MCSIDTTRAILLPNSNNGNKVKGLKWVIIEMLNGKISSFTDENGAPFPEYLERLTVDKYPVSDFITHGFLMTHRSIDKGVDSLKVEYDKQYGFPSKIILDGSINTIDDEIEFTIDKFEVIK